MIPSQTPSGLSEIIISLDALQRSVNSSYHKALAWRSFGPQWNDKASHTGLFWTHCLPGELCSGSRMTGAADAVHFNNPLVTIFPGPFCSGATLTLSRTFGKH
jgi:hypothetical protein